MQVTPSGGYSMQGSLVPFELSMSRVPNPVRSGATTEGPPLSRQVNRAVPGAAEDFPKRYGPGPSR